MLNTVKKIGPVLDLFTAQRPEWRMTEIARALDMPKSSAHSLVSTLADVGLLATTESGRYRLGWNLLSLSERMQASLDFRTHALTPMQALAGKVQETVLLAALDREKVIYVERVEGHHPMVRLAGVRIGSKAPAHATAVGKVLLADREPAEVRARFVESGLRALTLHTITDVDALEAELAKTRARGYAIESGEIVPDIACIAAPVHGRYGAVVAAISVAVPAYRFEAMRERILPTLEETAATVSTRLAQAQVERQPTELAETELVVVP